jgi:adenylate cyclase
LKRIFVCIGIGGLGFFLMLFPWAASLEEDLGLHLLFHLRGPIQPPDDVVLVAIDRPAAAHLNLPLEPVKWPRSLHARLVRQLVNAGASVIVFDVIFNTPQSGDADDAFAAALLQSGNVVLAQSLTRDTVFQEGLPDATATGIHLEEVISPIAPLASAAAGLAPFPLPRVPVKLSRYWLFKPEAGDIATLPVVALQIHARSIHKDLEALLASADPTAVSFLKAQDRLPEDRNPIPDLCRHFYLLLQERPYVADRMLALLDDASFSKLSEYAAHLIRALIGACRGPHSRYLNFYGPAGSIRTISYHHLLPIGGAAASNASMADLRNKVVFVGQTESTWPKATDGFYSVFSNKESGADVSGVEVAATAFANLLENRSVRPVSPLTRMAVIFMWGVVVAMICQWLPAAAAAGSLLVMGGLYLAAVYHRFVVAADWYPVVIPLFILLPVIFLVTLVWRYGRVTRERRNIRTAFGYYLPNTVVDQLSQNIKEVQSLAQTVYGICLVTDAARYTALSEALDPQALTHLMNRYYEAIFAPIKSCGGIIVQVVGDSVLSLWTASGPAAGIESKACDCALDIVSAVQRFNTQMADHQLPTRIGIHAGYFTLGNIGAMDHFEYRPVGDIVNTASRLEGLNKQLGTQILISEQVAAHLYNGAARCVGKFVMVGKSAPTVAHELLPREARREERQFDLRNRFLYGLEAFQQRRWQTADEVFRRITEDFGADGPTQFYYEQNLKFQQSPPDTGWDGRIRLTHK